MIKFIRKHYILTVFIMIPFILYIYYYLTELRYQPDTRERRWYSVNLAEKFTKILDYKTKKHIKYTKCFVLAFEFRSYDERVKYLKFFDPKYNPYKLTDEQFYTSLIVNKPKFLLNIYKEGKLIDKKTIYITSNKSLFQEEINGRKFELQQVYGHFQPRVSACYRFIENSHYTLELINDTPMPEFQHVETFFGIIRLTAK